MLLVIIKKPQNTCKGQVTVKCYQNLITCKGHHNTFYQLTSISEQQFFNYCADTQKDVQTYTWTDECQ